MGNTGNIDDKDNMVNNENRANKGIFGRLSIEMIWILLLIFIPVTLCGCTNDMNRKEIDEINFIHTIGIDYANGQYTLSALYSSGGGADPESSGSGTEEVTKGIGKTPYEAFENLVLKNKKAITVAQAGFFLIGNDAAANGIDACLDFLSRDETIKMESLVYVTKDMTAADFIEKGIENKATVHEDLEAIKQKQNELVTRLDNTLVNLMNEMKQPYSSLLIPYLVYDEKSFLINGYAIFDDLKLKDYLDTETSSGINFVKNIIKRYPIYLDNKVGLSLSNAHTKLKSELEGSKVRITVKVDFDTMIKEVNTKENLLSTDGLQRLTEEQNEYIKKIIMKAADYSNTTGLDILQLARIVENQHVKEWKSMKENWKESIADIKYDYVINSKISKSFILGNER